MPTQSPTKPTRPSVVKGSLARRVLILFDGARPVSEFTVGQEAVVGVEQIPPQLCRETYLLEEALCPREFCLFFLVFFPAATRFCVCGTTPEADALYSELADQAAQLGGFEVLRVGVT